MSSNDADEETLHLLAGCRSLPYWDTSQGTTRHETARLTHLRRNGIRFHKQYIGVIRSCKSSKRKNPVGLRNQNRPSWFISARRPDIWIINMRANDNNHQRRSTGRQRFCAKAKEKLENAKGLCCRSVADPTFGVGRAQWPEPEK